MSNLIRHEFLPRRVMLPWYRIVPSIYAQVQICSRSLKGSYHERRTQEYAFQAPTTVEEAGRLCYGLCRNTAYAAAARGDIPTIRIGRLLKVPTAMLRAKLGLEVA